MVKQKGTTASRHDASCFKNVWRKLKLKAKRHIECNDTTIHSPSLEYSRKAGDYYQVLLHEKELASPPSGSSVYYTPMTDETYADDDEQVCDAESIAAIQEDIDFSIVCGHIEQERLMVMQSSPQAHPPPAMLDGATAHRAAMPERSDTPCSLTHLSPISTEEVVRPDVEVYDKAVRGVRVVNLPSFMQDGPVCCQLYDLYIKAGECMRSVGLVPCVSKCLPASAVRYETTPSGEFVCLGEGKYGIVYLGRISATGKLVAIKLFKKKTTKVTDIISEASILQELDGSGVTPKLHGLAFMNKHPGFKQAALVTSFLGDPETFEVTDFRSFVNACHPSRGRDRLALADSQWVLLLTAIMEKILEVHSRGIVIMDLKADNILMEFSAGIWQPYIIDVGLAVYRQGPVRVPTPSRDIEKYLQVYRQVAPEVAYKGTCSNKADVFSFGRLVESLHHHLDLAVKDLAEQCLRKDVSFRPGDDAVLGQLYTIYNNFKRREIARMIA